MGMAGRARQGRITRITQRLATDGEGILALLVAVAVGVVAVLDVLGAERVNAAILLVLALLAATLLRDRQSARRAVEQGAAVRQVDAYAGRKELLDACPSTSALDFRGGVGEVLRALTLPECLAGRGNAVLKVRLEVLDPDNTELCTAYAGVRAGQLTSAAGRNGWTAARTREELLATVFAACWYQQRFPSLEIRVGLSPVLHTVSWHRLDDRLVVTEDGREGDTLVIRTGQTYYTVFENDMVASFRRARELPLSGVPDIPERLRGEHVGAVLTALGFDVTDYSPRDLYEIARLALRPYESRLDSARRAFDRRADPALRP